MRSRWGFVFLVLAACGGDETETTPAPVDVYEGEPFSSTRIADASVTAALRVMGRDGTLVFDGVPEAIADLDRRQVLLAPPGPAAPAGLLKVVLERSLD